MDAASPDEPARNRARSPGTDGSVPATTAGAQPPESVLRAFGAEGERARLPGGRGVTWRVGQTVLRPVDGVEEAAWKSEVLSRLEPTRGFSVARPIRDDGGEWVRDGWQAMDWVPGAADVSRVDDVVEAGAAFHRAISSIPRPSFIAESDDAWSRADRMAWGEEDAPSEPLLDALRRQFRSTPSRSQVIHGDLLGNVMFAAGRSPAVIDWAPYWRPAGLGAAIAVVDAVCWHEHPIGELDRSYGNDHWRQLLLRAMAFRAITLGLLGLWTPAQHRRHAPVVEAIIALPE